MKRWASVRLALRVYAAMAGPMAPFAGGGWMTGLLLASAAGAGLLSVDLPRDRWTPEELEAHRRKLAGDGKGPRRPTRRNPLLRLLLWGITP